MLKDGFNRLAEYLLQLNLFKTTSSTEETVVEERVLTRIYLVLLCCLLLAIGVGSASVVRTVSNNEYSPSMTRFQYLARKYPDTLQCPCSKAGIVYNKFLSTHVRFHQVCSSRFVTQSWINAAFAASHSFLSTGDHFRDTLTFFWQTVASLCQSSNQTWDGAMSDFGASYILSPKALTEEQIRSQADSDLRNHIASTEAKLSSTFGALQRSIAGNQFVSALATNFYLNRPTTPFEVWSSPGMSPRIFDDCSCIRMAGCPRPATVNDTRGEMVRVPGMIADCLVVDATLRSTLECYYDRACVSLLHGSDSASVKLLSSNANKYFSRNSTVQALLDKIFIDDLNIEIRFDPFYTQCQPAYCSYSYSHRFDKIFVVTTLIGVFGGLSLLLRHAVRLSAMAIQRFRKRGRTAQTSQETRVSAFEGGKCNNDSAKHVTIVGTCLGSLSGLDLVGRVKKLIEAIRQQLWSLNLFESEVAEGSVRDQERITTRVFLLALLGCCAIAGFYIFIVQQEQLNTVLHPSADEYRSLYENYGRSLLCPCSQLSVPYAKLLNVTYVLHQVCSSGMISAEWLNYLISFDPTPVASPTVARFATDFRIFGASYFQFLDTFCSLSSETIESEQTISRSKELINNNVLSPGIFSQQVNATIEAFVNTTLNRFTKMLAWIDMDNSVNQFLTGTNINFNAKLAGNEVLFEGVLVTVLYYISHEALDIGSTCSCTKDTSSCRLALLLFKNGTLLFDYARYFEEIPMGCIPYYGFSRSSIAWWYERDYIEDIRESYTYVIHSQSAPAVQPLNRSVSTRFYNRAVADLRNAMFVESTVKEAAIFDTFYSECAPKSCTYKIVRRREVFVALLLLISVCGGLARGLRFLIPLLSKCAFLCLEKWHSRNHTRRK